MDTSDNNATAPVLDAEGVVVEGTEEVTETPEETTTPEEVVADTE